MQKLLAFNVLAGGGSRGRALCDYVDRHEPDILVLTEWTERGSAAHFHAWAEQRSMHKHQRINRKTGRGVFIAARAPFEIDDISQPDAASGVLLQAHFTDFCLLGAYFPQDKAKAAFFDRCAKLAESDADTPLLIVGDLNTGNQSLDKSLAGAPYACASSFDSLVGDSHLIDLWRHSHSQDAREWSWLSHTGNGFRIDHAFANQPFLEQYAPACTYDHTPRADKLSDHSAISVAWHRRTLQTEAAAK